MRLWDDEPDLGLDAARFDDLSDAELLARIVQRGTALDWARSLVLHRDHRVVRREIRRILERGA